MSKIIINSSPNRTYEISTDGANIIFRGDFYSYDGSDVYPVYNGFASIPASDYLGAGRLNYSSMRRYFTVIFAGVFLLGAIWLLDTTRNIVAKAGYIGMELNVPLPITIIYYLLLVLCGYLIIRYLLSRKKFVEISFIRNRICVPTNSISNQELAYLQQEITNIRRR